MTVLPLVLSAFVLKKTSKPLSMLLLVEMSLARKGTARTLSASCGRMARMLSFQDATIAGAVQGKIEVKKE